MKKIFSILAASMLAMSMWAGELTVADGTVTNEYLPIYGYYADTGFSSEFIYPASDMASLNGSVISALQFYSANATTAFPSGELTIKFAEVTYTTISEYIDDAVFDTVYTGAFEINDGVLAFTLSKPYTYNGGNLLVQIVLSKKSSKCPTTSFYGIDATGNGLGRYVSGGSNADYVRNFLPKATFEYGGGAGVTCNEPTQLKNTILPDGGVFSWSGEEGARYQYCVVEKDEAAAGWELLDADVFTCTISGLTAGTEYDFYVRTYCSETDQSAAYKRSFTPVCEAPTHLTLSDLGAHSVNLAWDGATGVTQYQYACVLKGAAVEWDGVEAKTGLAVAIDTLKANTSYDFYVRSYFNAGVQSTASKLSFTTDCETNSIGWTVDFEDGKLPTCWDNSHYTGKQWTVSTYEHYSGNYSIRYQSNSHESHTDSLITPATLLDEEALFSFYYKNGGVKAELFANYDGKDSLLLNFAEASAWTKVSIDLSEFVGKEVRFFFRGHGKGSSSSKYLDIDDVELTYKPCAVPTNLNAEATADGANVTWESAEGASWNLRYRESEAEPEANWTIVANLTEKSLTLEGLTEGTTYEVQVQAVASTHRVSEWSASATFIPTACADVTKVSFADATYNSVDVAWIATGAGIWELRYKAGEGEWTTVSDIAETHHVLTGLTTNAVYSIEVKAACGDASTWVAAAKTFTPVYSAPVAGEAETITDLGATVQWLGVTDADTYEYDFVLPGAAAAWKQTTALTATADDLLAGTDYLFVVRTKYPTGVSEADTTEFATITIAPKNLAQEGEATVSSAVFTWEANGAATQWQWRVDNGAWSEPISVLTATADELEAGTAFTFYVRSYYSATVQSAAISLAFQTACAEKEVGFSESFESGVPACWESTGSWNTTTEFFHRGNAIRINARNASGSLTTPTINIDTDNAVLIFYQRNQYGGGNYVAAKVIITPAGEEATEIGFVNAADLTKQVIALSAFEGKKVTIQFSIPNTGASSSAYVYIDEVQVVETCDAPTDLAVQTDETGATITWTAGSGAQQLRYKSMAADDWTTINDATSPYVLTELEEDADYAVQVRSVCSEENASDWSATVSFSTSAGTGIATIHTDTDAVKRLEDGRLVIISNGVKYNAQGTLLK